MAIQDRTQVGQPVPAAPVLPSQYPQAPEKLVKAFPGFEEFRSEQEALYKRIRESLTASHQALALPIETTQNKLNSFEGYVKTLIKAGTIGGDWYAAVQTEASARIDGDTAIASRVDTVEATVSGVNAAVVTEASARANADSALGSRIDTVTATLNSDLTAAVTTEATARVSADSALGTRIDTVTATVSGVSAAVTTESTARVSADTALGTRIDTVTATLTADIAAAVTTESTARVSADTALGTRIDTVTATVSGVSAAVTTEATARVSADTALGSRVDTVEASVGTVSAAVTTEASARATEDTALGSRIDTVTATVSGVSAAVTTESTARVSADTALGSRIDTVTATISGVSAAVTTEASARATEDTALGSRIDTVTASVNGVSAAVTTEASTRASADVAIGTRIDAIEVSMPNAWTAAITAESTARVDADGALGVRIDNVITTVNGVSASVTAESTARSTADGFLSGNYTLRVAAGNVVTGMSITSAVASNGGQTSDVIFQASSFKIYDGSSAQAVFTASGGVVTINGSLIAPGTIGNSLFDAATTTKLSQLGVTGLYSGTIAANQIVASSLTAISATLGSAVVGTNGSLRQGQTAYNTGTGFWIGDVAGTPKVSIGNAGGNRLTWDGTTLSIVGSITITNTIPAANVSGLASVATSGSYANLSGTPNTTYINGSGIYTGTLVAGQITAATATLGSLSAVNAELGTVAISAGSLRSGQTAFDSGTGFWMGTVSGTPKFSIGNSSGNKLVWDGSTLSITGSLTLTNTIPAAKVTDLATVATSGSYSNLSGTPNTTYINGSGIYTGTLQANQIVATNLSAISATLGAVVVGSGGSLRQGQSSYDSGTGFWLGDASGTPKFSLGNSGGNKLTWDGSTLSITGSITLTNTIPAANVSGLAAVATTGTLAAGSVSGLAAVATSGSYSNLSGTPNTTYINGSGIYTGSLVAGQITAATASLGSLSALKAELGDVVITTSGFLRSGQSAYDSGTGFWLGTVSGTPKFSIGNSSGNKLTWDGSSLAVTANEMNLGRIAIKATSNPWDNSAVLTVAKVYAPTLTPVSLGSYAHTGASATYDRGQLRLEGYANVLGDVGYMRFDADPASIAWRSADDYAGVASAPAAQIYGSSATGLSFYIGGTEKVRVSASETVFSTSVRISGGGNVGSIYRDASGTTLSDTTRSGLVVGTNGFFVYNTYSYSPKLVAAGALGVAPDGCTTTDVVRAQTIRTAGYLLAGGTSANVDVDLSGYVFGAKPTVGLVQIQGLPNVKAYYNFDAAGSTSTNAVVTFEAHAGHTLPNGYVRIFFIFQYIA